MRAIPMILCGLLMVGGLVTTRVDAQEGPGVPPPVPPVTILSEKVR